MSPGVRAFVVLAAILSTTGFIYQELLWSGYIDDGDRGYVALGRTWAHYYENYDAASHETVGDSWNAAVAIFKQPDIQRPPNTGGFYQPLVAASLAADAAMATNSLVEGFHFHLTNVALHLLNCALVFILLRRFTRSLLWPALLTLLFALHPVQVESVAWVSQRMTLMAATFSLTAVLCYVRYAQTGHSRWMLPTLVLYGCILLTRPLFITLPAVLLLLDVWPLKRQGWRTLIEKLPIFGLMALGAYLDGRVRSQAEPVRDAIYGAGAMVAHQATALATRLMYPFALSPYHPMETTIGTIALGRVVDVIFVVALLVVLVVAFRRSRPIFVALAGLVLLVVPALIQAPFTIWLLSDQYLYLALLVPAICVATYFGRDETVKPQLKRWSAIAMTCVVAACGVGAYSQSIYWQSDRDMAERSIELYPNQAFGYIALVEANVRDREFDAALHVAEKALEVEPDNPSTQFYLGTVLLLHQSNRSAKAISLLETALRTNPDWIECLQNLGVALARNGRTIEAIKYLERARDLNPKSAGIRLGLGNAYLEMKKYSEARREFAEALKRHNDPSAHLGLAIAWAANDMPDLAQRHLAAAVAKDPKAALRAGRSPQLRRLLNQPGFDALISVDPSASPADARSTESPTSFEHGGAS